MARSFDIDFEWDEPDGAKADLDAMSDEQRAETIGLLERLRDQDIIGFERLPWKRGPLGAWILVSLRDWRYICQWSAGIPKLWRLDLGRGMLTVARVVHKDYAQAVLAEAKSRVDDE